MDRFLPVCVSVGAGLWTSLLGSTFSAVWVQIADSVFVSSFEFSITMEKKNKRKWMWMSQGCSEGTGSHD